MKSSKLILATLFFAICLCYPTSINLLNIKIIIAILLALIGIASAVVSKNILSFHPISFLWLGLYCCFGMVFSLIGLMNDGPGALKMLQVYVFWPAFYFFTFSLYNPSSLKSALNISILLSSWIIGATAILLLLLPSIFGEIAYTSFVDLISMGSVVGSASFESFFGFTMPGLMSMPFIYGYLTGNLLFSNQKTQIWNWTWGLAFVTCMLSGRNALVLTIISTPFIIFALCVASGNKVMLRKIAALIGIWFRCGVIISIALLVLAPVIFEDVTKLFLDNLAGSVNEVREEQASHLLSGFVEHIFFGVGLGVPHPSVIRSVDSPWSYELSYHAILYQTGVFGFLLYSVILLLPVYMILIQRNNRYEPSIHSESYAFATGLLCMYIANATNPYFNRFDAIWLLAIVPAILSRASIKSTNRIRA